MRSLLLLLALAAAKHSGMPPKEHSTSAVSARMRQAAQQLLAALPEKARNRIQRPFDDKDRVDWHYTPRSRNGVALKELDARGREAVHALLKQALSTTGYRKVVNIIELELVLRELETFGLMRDPERYHLTVYGKPDAEGAWGWRFEGHHLSLNFTLAGDRQTVDTPSFLGANPAQVAKGTKAAAAGLRVLAAEEDEARTLLASLPDDQRRQAVFNQSTYGDIVTRNAAAVDPLAPVGLAAAKMTAEQRAQLLRLIEAYARTFEASLAEARLARVREGGVEKIHFAWAGATQRGGAHYYRVQGPLFLIEYDSSQNDGNHIHTVWRDFRGDFGRDLLREHYESARSDGTGRHRHGDALDRSASDK